MKASIESYSDKENLLKIVTDVNEVFYISPVSIEGLEGDPKEYLNKVVTINKKEGKVILVLDIDETLARKKAISNLYKDTMWYYEKQE